MKKLFVISYYDKHGELKSEFIHADTKSFAMIVFNRLDIEKPKIKRITTYEKVGVEDFL